MIDMLNIQKQAFANKLNKGLNATDVCMEFCLTYGELSEAYEAFHLNRIAQVGEELADVAIYLLGIAEMLSINLEEEITKKISINENREYELVNGALVKKDC